MLRIPIASITETGWNLDEQVDSAHLPLLAGLSRDGDVEFTRPVRARIHATLAGESVALDGRVQAAVRLACSRCLETFECTLDTDFTATAIPDRTALDEDDANEDIELSAIEMDVIPFTGDSIDLSAEIAQQIIMALPYKPLCREDCKGLCGRCGNDLNHHPCQCDRQDPGSPFSVLKTLTFPPKKD